MAYKIKRIESERFTKYNINGDILSTGQDAGHAYVICLETTLDNDVLLSIASEDRFLNVINSKDEYPDWTFTVYLFGIGAPDCAMQFATQSEAQKAIDYIKANPNRFIRKEDSLWKYVKLN